MRSSRSPARALLLALVLHPVVGLACVPEEGSAMPCCDQPTDGCHSDSEASSCCTDAAPSAPDAAVTTVVALGLAGGRDEAVPAVGPLPTSLGTAEVSPHLAPHLARPLDEPPDRLFTLRL